MMKRKKHIMSDRNGPEKVVYEYRVEVIKASYSVGMI